KCKPTDLQWGQLKPGTRLGKVEPVFPRADKSAIERMQRLEDKDRPAAPATEAKQEAPAGAGAQAGEPSTQAVGAAAPATANQTIAIDDFLKIDLRVAQVKVA